MKRRDSLMLAIVLVLGGVLVAAWRLTGSSGPRVDVSRIDAIGPSAEPPPALAGSGAKSAEPLLVLRFSEAMDEIERAAGVEEPKARPAPPRPSPESVTVLVTSGHTPIAEARVCIRLQGPDLRPLAEGTTNAAGVAVFEFALIAATVLARGLRSPPGVRVEAHAEGYALRFEDYPALPEDGRLGIGLALGVPFDGRVIDAITSTPIPGATVTMRGDFGDFLLRPTDERGVFHVPGARDGSVVELAAHAPGRATARQSVLVQENNLSDNDAVVLRLEAGGSISGTVQAPDGSAVPGATVTFAPQQESPAVPDAGAMSKSGPDLTWLLEMDDSVHDDSLEEQRAGHISVTTDAEGVYRIANLPLDAEFVGTALAPGFAPSLPVQGLRATSGDERPVGALRLRRGATLRVSVGVPVDSPLLTKLRIRLFLSPDLEMRSPAGTSDRMTYEFLDLAPGHGHVLVQCSGFRSSVAPAQWAEGATRELHVQLERGEAIEGTVFDVEGRPVADALVTVAPAAQNPNGWPHLIGGKVGSTDAQGRFSIFGLAPGEAVLAAELRDRWGSVQMATRERMTVLSPSRGARVVLRRRGSVRLRLLTPEGRPFTGWVQIHWPSGWEASSVKEGSDGRVLVTGLEDGQHALIVAPDKLAWSRRELTIEDGADVDLGIVRLGDGRTLSGQVVDGTGRPIPGAMVMCEENEDRSVETDAQGRFSLDRFPRESVTLLVRAVGYAQGTLHVAPSQSAGLHAVLKGPTTVRGRVHSPEPHAPGSSLELRPRGVAPVMRRWFGSDGKVSDLPGYPGAHYVPLDASGRFEHQLPAGEYEGWWRSAGKQLRVGEWTFAEGETRELEIVLPPP